MVQWKAAAVGISIALAAVAVSTVAAQGGGDRVNAAPAQLRAAAPQGEAPGDPEGAQAPLAWAARAGNGGAHPASAGGSLSNEEILRNLTTVVFGSEFLGEDTPYIRKWIGPMRVAVAGDPQGRYSDLIDAHLATLRQLTGLDIARVRDAASAGVNARILFLDRASFIASARGYLAKGKPGTNHNLACFGVFKSNRDRDIVQFSAMIPSDGSRENVAACIVEEVTQVLGLPNDSYDIHPTIFNDDDEYHQLTWQDRLMVRVLYDRRVAPGMSRGAFTAVARRIIDELHPTTMVAASVPPAPAIETASARPAR
jgi:hypothetical protein